MTPARHCTAPGCGSMAEGYSTLCHPHRQTLRRHGHAQQTGITVHELRPYLGRVEAMQERNKGSEAWPLLVARWGALEGHSRGILDQVAKGLAYLKHERKAAEQVITLAGSVPAEKVVRTALAMFIMLEERPTRFLSDQAFRFQLVRRVRGLSAVNAGEYHDYRTGKSRKVYRDMPPEAVKVLGQWVAEAFGASGSKLASMEQEKARQSAAEKQRLADALEGLQ